VPRDLELVPVVERISPCDAGAFKQRGIAQGLGYLTEVDPAVVGGVAIGTGRLALLLVASREPPQLVLGQQPGGVRQQGIAHAVVVVRCQGVDPLDPVLVLPRLRGSIEPQQAGIAKRVTDDPGGVVEPLEHVRVGTDECIS